MPFEFNLAPYYKRAIRLRRFLVALGRCRTCDALHPGPIFPMLRNSASRPEIGFPGRSPISGPEALLRNIGYLSPSDTGALFKSPDRRTVLNL